MANTRFCLPTNAVSKENCLNLGCSQIKSFNVDGCKRKQSATASSQSGLLVSHMGHEYVLCQVRPVRQSRPLGFGITKQVIKQKPQNTCVTPQL